MQISKYCYAVTGLYFLPPWSVNAGFITGKNKTMIIDTGATRSAAETIYGYAKAAKPENEIIVVNTEKHLDHIGGNILFHEKGIKIFGHEGIERTDADLEVMISEFGLYITDKDRKLNHEERILFKNAGIINPHYKINKDIEIDLGGITVKIILTPGHTQTNISVFLPKEKALFCGDCLLQDFLPNCGAGDSKAWIKSLKKIKALSPEIVMPGHGSIISGSENINSEIERFLNYLKKYL